MAVDALGNLCIATLMHGGITMVSPDGSMTSHVALPDKVTYAVRRSLPPKQRLVVKRSGSGRLVAIDDWPVPGLRLNYEA